MDAPDPAWVPPEDQYDWIQLKSGEWLKGRIKGMQNRKLDFDSVELHDLTFDWDDIRQVRSAGRLDLLLDERDADDVSAQNAKSRELLPIRKLAGSGKELSGVVTITPEEVRVVDGVVRTIIPRESLNSLTPGGGREWDYWSGTASIGLTLRSGNLDQVEYNAMGHLERRTPKSRVSLDYNGNISSIDEVESANNHRVNSEVDLWLSGRVYVILPSFEWYKDPFQNLDYRMTLGVGLGYDIISTTKHEWTISTGPAWQKAKFLSAEPGGPISSESGAVTLSSRFSWEISSRTDLTMEYRGQFTKKEIGDTTLYFNSTLSFELTQVFDLDVSFFWDRIKNPNAGEDGVAPEPNDFRLVFGFGMDF